MRRAGLALLLVSLAAACSQQQTVVSTHDFDRPTDMVFGCVGLFPQADGPAVASGRPMAACRNPDEPDDKSTHRRFAFVTNSARGELSAIQFVTTNGVEVDKLVDLDPAIAGFNTAPLGELPEAMSASDDGCRLVTANRGSCDLTLVDPGRLMAKTIANQSVDAGEPEASTASPTQTVVVRTGSGKPLAASPYEIQFLHQDTSALDATKLCLPERPQIPPIGWNDDQSGWKALVTFPACDLVAVVDLPSGVIVDSVKVKADAGGKHAAITHTGTEPVCPVECGVGARPETVTDAGQATETAADGPAEAPSPDASDAVADDADMSDADLSGEGGPVDATDDGGAQEAPPPAPIGPFSDAIGVLGVGPLALDPRGGRAYVGLTNAPQVVSVDMVAGRLSAVKENDAGIFLQDAIGVRRVRLSVDPFNDNSNFPFIVEGDHQTRKYLYAIASDGTVRVVNINPGAMGECDNNIDLGVLTPAERADVANRDCVSVAEAQAKGWHNLFVTGPGIHLPSNPRDVAFSKVGAANPQNLDQISNQLLGVFAFVLTDSGAVYVLNIEPGVRKAAAVVGGMAGTTDMPINLVEPTPLPNTLRNRNWTPFALSQDTAHGPPRLDLPPSALPYGPRLERVSAFDTKDNGLATTGTVPLDTWVSFPNYFDKGAPVTPQSWSVTWEGLLIGLRFGGRRTGPSMSADTGTITDSFLTDPGGGFCDAGVTSGDIVTFIGCVDNNQCGAGQVCAHSPTAPQSATGLPINGLCLNPDQMIQDQQVKVTCRRLLESVRRYTVVAARPGQLVLRPHVDEYVQVQQLSSNPFRCQKAGEMCGPPDSPDTSYSAFRCVNLGDDKTPDLRCVNPCGQPKKDDKGNEVTPEVDQGDVDCRAGRKCVDFGTRGGRLCADAPSEPGEGGVAGASGCFPQLTTYSVQAGRSFLVQGSSTAIPVATVPTAAPPNDFCPPPASSASPLAYRISLDGPACDVTKFDPPLNTQAALLALDSRQVINNATDTNLPLKLLQQPPTTNNNPCLFLGGPNDSDLGSVTATGADGGAAAAADGGSTDGGASTMRAPGQHIRALFRNTEVQFILSNIEQQGANNYQVRFDVHGGFVPQSVLTPSGVEISLPSRILTSPITSAYVGPTNSVGPTASYLFVVDQRRLGRNRLAGGATRGQVLRINLQRYNSADESSPLLIYDDPTGTAGQYPIQ